MHLIVSHNQRTRARTSFKEWNEYNMTYQAKQFNFRDAWFFSPETDICFSRKRKSVFGNEKSVIIFQILAKYLNENCKVNIYCFLASFMSSYLFFNKIQQQNIYGISPSAKSEKASNNKVCVIPLQTAFLLHEIKVWYLNCRFPCVVLKLKTRRMV